MKFVTSKDKLLKTIQKVQNAISSKTTLPILANILIEGHKSSIKITATDLDLGISSILAVKPDIEGAITVPAKKFMDIIKELPETPEISITAKKNNMVTIECGKIVFKIVGLPKDDFPQQPKINTQDKVTLPKEFLKNMISMTAFAASRDETRYILNGVLLIINNKIVKLVATDGRRLAVIKKKVSVETTVDKKIVIPTKTIQELSKLLTEEGDVDILFDENQVFFNLGDTTIISRLIDGEFPNYEQVIPGETKEKAVIDKEALLAATKRASLFINPESMAVRLDISKNHMAISKNIPYMGEVKEELGISYHGKDLSVGFNPNYIIEVLKNIDAKEVGLELIDNDKPGVIRLGDEYVYVVLPMQIN